MKHKPLSTGTIIGLIIVVTLAVAYHAIFGPPTMFRSIPFNQGLWLTEDKTPRQRSEFRRLKMADDLITKRTLYGLNRKQIIELLGKPALDNKQWDGKYDLVYWLGPERGIFSIDSEWLAIRFNQQGKVDHYRLVRD